MAFSKPSEIMILGGIGGKFGDQKLKGGLYFDTTNREVKFIKSFIDRGMTFTTCNSHFKTRQGKIRVLVETEEDSHQLIEVSDNGEDQTVLMNLSI